MRFIFILSIAFLGLYACNNDLTTIGQNLIDNGNHIEVATTQLTETGTIKLDSFVTSSGRYGNAITEMYMGSYTDEYSGTTVATPCFQIVPSYRPEIPYHFALDSVTFNFTYGGKMWGDTLAPAPQRYKLFQLKELPELHSSNYDYFYNVDTILYGEELAEVEFLPKRQMMKYAHFRIKHPIVNTMFRMMQDYDEIFKPSSAENIQFYKFISWFKGLAIQSVDGNNCMMSIQAIADSLYMRFYYHAGDDKRTFDLRLLTQNPVYNYNRIINTPAPAFAELTNQEQEVMFNLDTTAIAQGLSGYMVKIVIPQPEMPENYKTVIKAEIEIQPKVWASPIIALPPSLAVYATNKKNELKEVVYNSTNSAVTGTYVRDPQSSEGDRYYFDITDYYQRIVNSPYSEPLRQILLTVPNLTSSFDRMMIRQTPILRVYYAKYKD